MPKSNQNKTARAHCVTRLSRLHPYPAMVADELALALVEKYVPSRSRVLDPFCGSGRLLAAIEDAELRVGVDVNPLAWLLTKAKLATIDNIKMKSILEGIDIVRSKKSPVTYLKLATDRKVDWFSTNATKELASIIKWINKLELDEPELLLMASILSATTREVSYARQGGWKLHRLEADSRDSLSVSAWDCFKRRLTYCVNALITMSPLQGQSFVEIGDSSNCHTISNLLVNHGLFDVVITSPPYGDSLTTVQYGAASSLTLEAVGHIKGFEHLAYSGKTIDGTCLGGGLSIATIHENMKPYWAGSSKTLTARSVAKFLQDYDMFCQNVANSLRIGGKAILVVGRRSTGGFRLKLDKFTIDSLTTRGFRLLCSEERALCQKRFPSNINRFARSQSESKRDKGRVVTMQSEIILVMEKVFDA